MRRRKITAEAVVPETPSSHVTGDYADTYTKRQLRGERVADRRRQTVELPTCAVCGSVAGLPCTEVA